MVCALCTLTMYFTFKYRSGLQRTPLPLSPRTAFSRPNSDWLMKEKEICRDQADPYEQRHSSLPMLHYTQVSFMTVH